MTILIKVTFISTAGEEVTGQAQFDPGPGLVTLPLRLVELVQRAEAAGVGYALAAHEDGYRCRLIGVRENVYRIDRSQRHRETMLAQVLKALAAPTKDQRQQYGRFAHTLSAAAIIAAAGYLGTNRTWDVSAAIEVLALISTGVVLFLTGAVLSKGD